MNHAHGIVERNPRLTRVVLLLLTLVWSGLLQAQEGTSDWTGVWDSHWRDGGARLYLQQTGDRVTGDYPLYAGKIEATVQGRQLSGRWIEGGRSGEFLFVLARDGQSFTGRFDSGEWWTGARQEAETGAPEQLDQSTPMAALRSFLVAVNAATPGNMTRLGQAAALVRAQEPLSGDIDRFEQTRRLIEVLDQLTVRIWDLSRGNSGRDASVRLEQAGTGEAIRLQLRLENDRWFLVAPPVAQLESMRDRLRAARGLPPGPGLLHGTHGLDSPRATMRRFLASLSAQPDGRSPQALSTLDLSYLVESARAQEGPVLAGYLKRVIDRVGYVIEQEIPDDPGSRTPYVHFHHPAGDVVIAPTERDDGSLAWVFTPETLTRIRAVYAAMEDMPVAPGLRDDVADDPFFRLRDLIRSEAPSLLKPMGPMERWQWLGLGLSVLLSLLASLLLGRWMLHGCERAGWVNRTGAPTGYLLSRWAWRGLIAGSLVLGTTDLLGLPDTLLAVTGSTGWILVVIAGIVLGWQWIGALTERYRIRESVLGHNVILLSLASGITRIALLLGGGLLLADLLSLPLGGVLAGFGIGGLAVALAAQPTLQNLLAGFTLYADRPVSVGEFCRFGQTLGTVEHIGLRSTRLRTLDRSLISVPNAQFLDMQLENFARRDRRLFQTTLQLRYETTPDQLRYVLIALRELLIAHPMVLPEPMRVRLCGLGSHSLDIEVVAYIMAIDQDTYAAVREDVLLRILTLVEDAGAQFAFPAVVQYREDAVSSDPERIANAEAAIAGLRERDDLPFPDFDWQRKAELSNTLDYPPHGSTLAQRG